MAENLKNQACPAGVIPREYKEHPVSEAPYILLVGMGESREKMLICISENTIFHLFVQRLSLQYRSHIVFWGGFVTQ
ncbi:MAG TPA: hypothetical protein VF355_04095 [Anaerolineaceae bacterium]